MSSRCLWPENGKNLTAGEEKNVDCGAGTGTDPSKSNPCAPLFQLPAGNADGFISSILLSLFLLKALLTFRGPQVY